MLCKQHSQTLDQIPGRHTDRAWGSVNHNVARPIVNESLDESECNIPTNSQHANCTQRIGDLDNLTSKGKKKAMPQHQMEDVAGNDTPTSTQTQSIEDSLLKLLGELREKNSHSNLHSSPQYGAGFLGQPHTNPTPDASRSSDGRLPLRPEYKIPPAYVTKVYHHYHYHYNAPSGVSPPPIINKNIVKINNKNTSSGSESPESGDDEGKR